MSPGKKRRPAQSSNCPGNVLCLSFGWFDYEVRERKIGSMRGGGGGVPVVPLRRGGGGGDSGPPLVTTLGGIPTGSMQLSWRFSRDISSPSSLPRFRIYTRRGAAAEASLLFQVATHTHTHTRTRARARAPELSLCLSRTLDALPVRAIHAGFLNLIYLPHDTRRSNSACCPGRIVVAPSTTLGNSFTSVSKNIGKRNKTKLVTLKQTSCNALSTLYALSTWMSYCRF